METSERADQFRQSPNTNNPSSFVDVINILVVDDDSTTLAIVSAMLKTWSYQVVSVRNPIDALTTLRAKKGLFDLVVTDLHMPQMNGFELQKHIHEEFKLPVIMMSADDKESVIMKSLEGGVVYYIVKPVSKDDIKNVWQYAVAAKKGKSVAIEEIESAPREAHGEVEDGRNSAISSNGDEQDKEKQAEAAKNKKARKRPREDDDEELMVAPKKAKVVWTNSLHNQFLLAIRHIGLDKAVPKRILEFMNVPGLTRENVASHLQKYRLFLKRVADKARLSKCLSERVFRSSFAYGHPSFMFNNVGRDQLHQQLMKQQQMETSSIGSTFQPSLGGINGIGNGNTQALTTSASNNLGSSIQFPNQHQASSSRSNMPHQLIGCGQSRLLNNNQINILRGQQPMLLGNNGNNLQLSQPNYGRPAAIGMQQPMMNNLGNGGMSYSLMNNIGTNITGLTTNNIGTNNLMQIYPQQNQARQQAGLITNSPFCYNLATSGIQNGTNFTPMSPSIENMAAGTSFNNVNQLSLSGNFSRTTPLMNNINAGSGLLSNGYFNNEIINGLTNGVRNVNLSGASIGNVNSGYMVQFGAGSNSSMSSAGFETSNIASAGQFPPVCNQTNINIDQQQNVFSELTPPAENNIEQYGGGLSNLAGGGNIIDNSYSLMNNTNTAPTLINNNNTSQEQEFVNDNDDEDMMMLRNLFMEQHNNVYQPPPYDQQQGGEDHQLPPDFSTFLYQTEMPNCTGNQQVMDPTANQAVDTPANQIVDSPANQVSNQDFYHVEESSNQLQGGGDQQALNREFSNNVFESEDFNMFGQNYPFQDFDDESINSILGPGL